MKGAMPEWYSRSKAVSERTYTQNKAANHGPDIDLNSYNVETPARDKIESLHACICKNTDLTHEAAIGKTAEEELLYLMARGLARDKATSIIARGFLDAEIQGLRDKLLDEIKNMVAMTTEHVL